MATFMETQLHWCLKPQFLLLPDATTYRAVCSEGQEFGDCEDGLSLPHRVWGLYRQMQG